MPEPAELALFSREELGFPARPEPPAPMKTRFQPLRAGILNLWQYDDQELRFHHGRLILRGENGTGKSKALELLLPFLFDADLSPHRLDPFAGTARSMRWNLLEGDRHENRVGYVWLELGRVDASGKEEGEPITLTLGAGLRATRRTDGVEAWYFLTSRRIGADLELLTPQRQPLLREQLRQALGEEGKVFQRADDYRHEVDRHLFGLGADRFAALRHLLLQLRRPHLSEKLDPKSLSDLLTESLPPIDQDLVHQLAEGFHRLERDQAELARIETAVAAVEVFRRVYAEYCQGLARARAAEVRGSESRYHKTAGLVREAAEAEQRAGETIATLDRREQETESGITAQRGVLAALEQSEAMQAAQALATKEQLAVEHERQSERARGDVETAAIEVREQERLCTLARARAETASVAREAAELRAREKAHAAGMEAVHAAVAAVLAEDASSARGTVAAALEERRSGVAELSVLVQERDRTHADYARAEERRRDADAQARSAAERTRAARTEAEREQERLDAALLAWAEGLEELQLSEEALVELRERAGEETTAEADLAIWLASLAQPQRDERLRARLATETESVRVVAERAAIEEERRRVESARELGPEPPRTRAEGRADRAGAPLYLLCDFAPALGETERAGLEAALEAAGLLDAWVMPDGRLLEAGTLDTVLAIEPRESGDLVGSLAELLVVEPGYGVETQVVEAILRSIAIGPEGEGGPLHRVAPDGSWRLGPLHGSWVKPCAEHLGAAAREAARARRLAELTEILAGLDRRLGELERLEREQAHGLERFDAELRALPRAAELRAARHALAAAQTEEERRRRELTEAETAAAAARAAREAAERRLAERAQKLHLTPWLDDLSGYLVRLEEYRNAFLELVRAEERAHETATTVVQTRETHARAELRAAELGRRAQASAELAIHARAEVETLRETVGVEAREVVARHRAAQDLLASLGAEQKRLREQLLEQREKRARLAVEHQLHEHQLAEQAAERERASARLRRLGELGLLALVLEVAPEDTPTTWTATHTLEVARAVEQATAEVDLSQEAANRRANRMHTRYQELVQELGGEFQPSFGHDEELQVVSVLHDQRAYDVPALEAMLREEAATRHGLLENEERELLEKFLLGEVGDHLRSRLRDAHALVEHMNGLLEKLKTASGMALRLAWGPDSEVDPETRAVVALLRRAVDLLNDEERKKLRDFLRERIAQARGDAKNVPWREHLLAALDYRRWHHFRLLRREAGETEWRELTRRGHAASSGGEKAVALHLPLFAAAAAHYESASPAAPRLILLDEAFAGIDVGMKGRCMGLLVAFDLDFMMTSHDEWGCYEELPGVATYQLYRDPLLGGVAAIRFVWDGAQLVEEG